MKKLILIPVLFTLFFNVASAQSGLVSYWNMDEGSGDVVADSVGVNNGTRINFTNGWVTGKYGNGLEFNTTAEQYVDCGNDSSLNVGADDFSVDFWIKTTQGANADILKPFNPQELLAKIKEKLGN